MSSHRSNLLFLLLERQPALGETLSRFAGEWVECVVIPFPTRLMIRLEASPSLLRITPTGVARVTSPTGETPFEGDLPQPDLRLSGSPGAFLAVLRSGDWSGLAIQGDDTLRQRVHQALRETPFDWPGLLAPYLGEDLVLGVTQWSRSLGRWLDRARDSLLEDAREYLHHEARSVPTRLDQDDRRTLTQALEEAADQLERRIRDLESRLANTSDERDI